jgi:trimeric autotransporter adhesin
MVPFKALAGVSTLALAVFAAQPGLAQVSESINQRLPLSDFCPPQNFDPTMGPARFSQCTTAVRGTESTTIVNPYTIADGHLTGDIHVDFDGLLQIDGTALQDPVFAASLYVDPATFNGITVDIATQYDTHVDIDLSTFVPSSDFAFNVTNADVRAINVDIQNATFGEGDDDEEEFGSFSLAAVDPSAVVNNAVELEGNFQTVSDSGAIQYGTLSGTATLQTGTLTSTLDGDHNFISPFALDIDVTETVTTQLDETGLIAPTVSVTDGINMNGSRITNLGAGVDANDAVTKAQLDAALAFTGEMANSVQIGEGSQALDGKSIAIGFGNTASGDGAVALGDPNVATGTGALAIGADNTATGTGAVALGNLSVANGNAAVGIGDQANAATAGSIAIGQTVQATGVTSTAVGNLAVASDEDGVALGDQASALGFHSTAVGGESDATGRGAQAFGWQSAATGDLSLASGHQAQATGVRSTAVGKSAVASAINSVAIGNQASTNSANAASLGTSVAVGNLAVASDEDAVAIGDQATASGFHSTAVGGESVASGRGAQAFGWQSRATGNLSLAAGHQANAGGVNATAIGKNANAAFDNSTAVGFGATTTRANQVVLGGTGSSVTVGDIAASTAAQSGATALVTVDASGTLGRDTALTTTLTNAANSITSLQAGQATLFDLAEHNRRDIRKANEGVAMALAMDTPAIPQGASFAVSGGVGYYQDKTAVTAAIAAAIGPMSQLSAGVGVGTNSGEVGARAGFQFAW